MRKLYKYTCTYAQAEAHTYIHAFAYMAHTTVTCHQIKVYNAHDCGKFCRRLLFYDNQHASSCIKAVSNVGQSRVGLCKQVIQKNFA